MNRDERLLSKPRHPGRELLDEVLDERFPYTPLDLIHETSRSRRALRVGDEQPPEYMRDDELTIRRRRRLLNEALSSETPADFPIHRTA